MALAGATASFKIENTLRKIDSNNVVAKLEGSDPALEDQYVIYTAHWDHLGRDPELKGDQIYNGAADNASGSAGLLEIAPRVHETVARAEAVDPFPFGDCRRAGFAGHGVLRGEPALSTQEHPGGYQYGRAEHLGEDEGPDNHRSGEFDARRYGGRGSQSA